MISRTQTPSAAHRIADRLRSFRRQGASGWSTTVDMDQTRASHELMVAQQFQQHHRSI
ncbi:hypothetical protein [Knoellia aerolata]|uniref:Uncharacterized protein n=1 Tax=Knoellia aerolata DSM 18566 TaxID=1385519 RepID=A0A0A0JYN6_9MICO|nr:hypothetical protein [Knoellia aerolata]KGN42303.1 hypothetical protein N801_00605 [Knoellia aerolata DSM 18566]